MQITVDRVVTIDFTMFDDNSGEILETSQTEGPLVYLHGMGELPEGLEDALEGKQAGDKVEITLPPEMAYGERDEDLVQSVSREQFEGIDDLQVGMRFEAETEEGPQLVRIIGLEEDDVIIDANEFYAGRTVRFDVTVLGVRDATEEELEHGHAHGEGEGCDHDHDDDFDDEEDEE